LKDEYAVSPGIYTIVFRGYALDKVDSEEDYYGVEIRKKG
jgi:hydrogenase maturation factor